MTDDDVITALLRSASDDWVMLHDVLWESTHDERTPAAKATVERVLERLFVQELLVPGELSETGFTDWNDRPEDWLPRAKAILRACDWQPMGDGFWLRLTRNGETWLSVDRFVAGAPECPNNDQGMVRPLVTESGVVVLMCDEGGEVWLHPADIDRIDPIVPSEPTWMVNDWVHIKPGTTRWADLNDVPQDWPQPITGPAPGTAQFCSRGDQIPGRPPSASAGASRAIGTVESVDQPRALFDGWTDDEI